jgi:hypothetical protein
LPYALIENDSMIDCAPTGIMFTPPKQVHTRITENDQIEAMLIMDLVTSILLFDVADRRLLSRTEIYAK